MFNIATKNHVAKYKRMQRDLLTLPRPRGKKKADFVRPVFTLHQQLNTYSATFGFRTAAEVEWMFPKELLLLGCIYSKKKKKLKKID